MDLTAAAMFSAPVTRWHRPSQAGGGPTNAEQLHLWRSHMVRRGRHRRPALWRDSSPESGSREPEPPCEHRRDADTPGRATAGLRWCPRSAKMLAVSHQLADELRGIAERLNDQAAHGEEEQEPLARLEQAVRTIEKSWSGSNMGYQSRVYYAGFEVPAPGAHFDSEWGFLGRFHGTTGDWHEVKADDVIQRIYETAGVSSLDEAATRANQARATWVEARPEVVSVLSAYLTQREDALVDELQTEAEAVKDLTEAQTARALVGRIGPKMIRDTTAFSQGFMAAPHQVVEAKIIAIRSAFAACSTLGRVAERGAAHIERLEASQHSKGQERGTAGETVFIGHGRSPLWRELKDFVSERLHLAWDEFNRVPVAGVTNIARLSEMLDNAGIAFVVLTAEDETIDGKERARQNVVHEAGLFQRRLGFSRAIVMLEEGCEEFSNIQGLGQIRFPRGQIGAVFEEVRQVLEREGFTDS